jgi:hypothetical protein
MHHQARTDATANITTIKSASAMDAPADPNTKTPSTKTSMTTVFLYSTLRNDRSGMVILDMLMAHAYVFFLNQQQRDQGGSGELQNETGGTAKAGARDELAAVRYVYGGACPRSNCTDPPQTVLHGQCSVHRELLQLCGLEKILPIACPPQTQPPPFPTDYITDSTSTYETAAGTNGPSSHHHPQQYRIMDNISEYQIGGMVERLEYHEALRKEILDAAPTKEASIPSKVMSRHSSDGSTTTAEAAMKKVAVHIRRGDIEMCGPNWSRYLPNQHYLDLIQQFAVDGPATKHGTHMKNLTTKNIVIHSEEPYWVAYPNATESLEDFTKLGLAVEVHATAAKVWKDMLDSDVIIMSRSSFSVVPALLVSAVYRTGVSVYTPPLDFIASMLEWVTVSKAQLKRTDKVLQRLRQERC